jgi:hypothetical protein
LTVATQLGAHLNWCLQGDQEIWEVQRNASLISSNSL